MPTEARILRETLLALSALKMNDGTRACVVWKQTVGTLLGPSGIPVKVGVKGMADIGGVLCTGRCLQIEVKSPTGRVRPEQITWGRMISEFGGLSLVVRSAEDACRGVIEALNA